MPGEVAVGAPVAAGAAAYDPESAFWVFRSLSNLVTPYFRHLIDDVRSVSLEFENEEFTRQSSIESKAQGLYGEDPLEVKPFLTKYVHGQAAKSLALAVMLKERLEVEIARHSFEW